MPAAMLNIGRTIDGNRTFTFPADAVTQTFGILGIKGAGKTNTGVVMAEEMIGTGHQVVVLDPLDVWWGLRSSADGKRAGLQVYVFGGQHADFPLDAKKGAEVADIAVEVGLSCVLSLRHLRKSEQRTFTTDFAERFYHRKGEARYQTPVHVFVDEADAFAPQRVMQDTARMLGSIDDLVRRGRSSGIGTSLITQRPATLNKDVLEMADTLVVHRIVGTPSRKAVDEWLSAHDTEGKRAEFMASLAGLKRGESWIWSPSWLDAFERVQIRARETYDSSATPKPGEKRAEPRTLAKVDVDQIRGRMAVVVAEAEAKDPKKLQAKIRDLDRELAAARKAVPPACDHLPKMAALELERNEYQQLLEALAKRVNIAAGAFEVARELAAQTLTQDGKMPNHVGQLPRQRPPADRYAARGTVSGTAVPVISPQRRRNNGNRQTDSSASTAADIDGLKAGAVRMLERIASTWPATWTASQVGALTGFTPSGGTFGQYMRALVARGLVEKQGNVYAATEAGVQALGGQPPAPADHGEVLAMWANALKAGAYRMLEIVIAAGDAGVDAATLAAESGFEQSGGTFGQYRRTLVRNGLVEDRGGYYVATDVLFP